MEALKAGRSMEQERSSWDAVHMPISHSAENTQTTQMMTGDGKWTINTLVQTYPEQENPEYEQEEAESRQNHKA